VIAGSLALIAVGAFTAHAMAATPPAKIFGSGSDVTYRYQVAMDTLYNNSAGCVTVPPPGQTQPLDFSCVADDASTVTTENYAHDVASQAYPNGASIGVNQLCANTPAAPNTFAVDFVRNTRTARTSDCTGLHFAAYALDGLAWVCFNACHGVTNITKTDLAKIFGDCSINKWNQLNTSAAADPIRVYGVKPGSGIKSNWNSFLGIPDDTGCVPQDGKHVIRQNQNAPIIANGDQNDAIFYWSVGNFKTKKGGDGSKLGSLNGVAPTIANIGSGTYPFSYFLSNVYCGQSGASGTGACPVAASQATLNYVHEVTGWLCRGSAASPHLTGTGGHASDPETGINYRTLIKKTINAYGFATIPWGPTGGTTTESSFCRQITVT
jgi:hypothetical protein